MPIKLGDNDINKIYRGEQAITSIYRGNTKIWPSSIISEIVWASGYPILRFWGGDAVYNPGGSANTLKFNCSLKNYLEIYANNEKVIWYEDTEDFVADMADAYGSVPSIEVYSEPNPMPINGDVTITTNLNRNIFQMYENWDENSGTGEFPAGCIWLRTYSVDNSGEASTRNARSLPSYWTEPLEEFLIYGDTTPPGSSADYLNIVDLTNKSIQLTKLAPCMAIEIIYDITTVIISA